MHLGNETDFGFSGGFLFWGIWFSGGGSQNVIYEFDPDEPCTATYDAATDTIIYHGNCEGLTASTAGGTSATTSTTSTSSTSSTTSSAGSSASTGGTGSSATGSSGFTGTTGMTASGSTTGTTGTTGIGFTGSAGSDGGGGIPDPVTSTSSDELGAGRILSWTKEDIKFKIGIGGDSRNTINSVSDVQFKIEKVEPSQSSKEIVCDWTSWDSFLSPSDSHAQITRRLRLDSTNFKDLTVLYFTTRVKLNVTKQGGTPQDLVVTSEPISAPVKNRISLHATHQAANPYYTSGIDYSNATQNAALSTQRILHDSTKFKTVAGASFYMYGHISSSGPSLEDTIPRQDVAALIGYTHGDPEGFWHSGTISDFDPTVGYGDYVRPRYDEFVSGKDTVSTGLSLKQLVGSRNALDPINCLILYACSTLSNGTGGTSEALLKNGPFTTASGTFSGQSDSYTDRAVMGQTGVLNMYVLQSGSTVTSGTYTTPHMLKFHSDVLINHLKDGDTLVDANAAANDVYSPLVLEYGTASSHTASNGKTYWSSPLTGMHTQSFTIVGDFYTRFRGLYLKDLEAASTQRISNSSTDSWLFIYKGRL